MTIAAMSTYESWSLVIQAVVGVGIFLTLFVYWRILVATQSQVEAARNGVLVQNTLEISKYLQSQEVREARGHLYRDVERLPFANWHQRDKDMASLVCANFDLAAFLGEKNAILPGILEENWGTTITRCHAICLPWLEFRRKDNANFWRPFSELNKRIPKDRRWLDEAKYLKQRP